MKNPKKLLFTFLVCCSVLTCASKAYGQLQVVDLKCEYATAPVGMDIREPQLSWRIESELKNVMQTSYRVLVSTSLEELSANKGSVWDSGEVNSGKATAVKYDGAPLASGKEYFWKVKASSGKTNSGWSEPTSFSTGLFNQDDWKTNWIAYVPGMQGRVLYFKGTFNNEKPIKKAYAYVAGLGFYEMSLNNKKVGDRVLEPAQSSYDRRVYYSTYDVTDRLTENANVVLISVTSGWYGTAKLRMQMDIEYTDGSRKLYTSDEMRSVATGPTVYSSIFDGEHYDARLAVPDLYEPWIPVGLMNKQWGFAHFTEAPGGDMVSQSIEPIRVVDTITPTAITEPEPGVYVIDAGRNLAGWASLQVKGEEGTKITLKFAESVYETGLINQENLRNAKVEDTYILSGKGVETWRPSFTYHGFRYIQVEGFPYRPQVGDIKVDIIRSDVALTGTFKCSNPLLNDIHRMIVNTEAANLHSVPTDCPQRDERMGWMNDLTVRIEQAIYNFDMSRFYPKFLDDVEDTQKQDGSITCVAPFRFGASPADPVSASYLLLAWECYRFYGNEQIVHDHYTGMKAWVDFLHSKTENGIVNYSYYGDWSPPIEFAAAPHSAVSRDTPGRMISTGYLYYCATILSEMAELTGHQTDVQFYKQLAEETSKAFNRDYWNEQSGGYATNNQASNSFALYMGLVGENKTEGVVNNLVENVKQHDYHLTTGNLCTKYLMEMLTKHGHQEVAYKIATQTTYPSWGYMLANGATTLWERWEFATGDAMNSHNHPMMGSVDTWFYKYVLGIRPEFEHPGFSKFTIQPVILDQLDFAEGELKTVKGAIKSAWKKSGSDLLLNVTVPANTVATVYVPVKHAKSVTAGGKAISRVKEIRIVEETADHIVAEVGSGSYQFNTRWK